MRKMKFAIALVAAGTALAQTPKSASGKAATNQATSAPSDKSASTVTPVATMSQLMTEIIYPTSNAIFYLYRGAPKDEKEWIAMRTMALTLAESGNLLMMEGRGPAEGKTMNGATRQKWIEDAKLLVDVGRLAFQAAQKKDVNAMVELNEQLNTSCVACHEDFRPGYKDRRAKP